MEQEPKQPIETQATPVAQSVVQPTQPTEEKKNFASRALVAAAFAKIFAGVINNPGQIIDINRVFQGEKMSIKDKVRAVWSGDAWQRLKAQSKAIIEQYPDNKIKGYLVAGNKVFKYTIITGVIGGAIGAVLGWSLGDRIKDSKDIVKHPVQSTKVLLGIKKPDGESASPAVLAQDKKPEQENNTKWQDYANERKADSVVMGKAV